MISKFANSFFLTYIHIWYEIGQTRFSGLDARAKNKQVQGPTKRIFPER